MYLQASEKAQHSGIVISSLHSPSSTPCGLPPASETQ